MANDWKMTVQKPAAGGTFWEALAAIRVRDANSADGDVVGELNKGDFVHVLSQDGDWCKVQNIWDARPTAWFMFQNKKGKQMAEPAGDQATAQTKWTQKMEDMVNGPPAAEADASGGGGFGAKKEMTAEEAEMLAILKGASSGGAPPPPEPTGAAKSPADEEAELLAILKGAGSAAPTDGGAAAAPAGSLEERLDDSNPNNRKGAYEELGELFKSTEDGASDVFSSKSELIVAVAQEKNANAFVAGIEPVSLFMARAQGAESKAAEVAGAMIKTGFKNAKAKVVSSCRACVVSCVEAGGPQVLEIIYEGMADSGPKVPVEATKCLADTVAAFGPYVLPLKEVVAKCVAQLDKPDKKVQEAAQKLLLELCKWMGTKALIFAIGKLNDKASKEFSAKVAESPKPSEMKPSRTLKVAGPAVSYEFDADGNCLIDLVEAVDLLENLKSTDFKEKIKSEKWNERVAAMELVVIACGAPPKLVDKDYSSVLDKLKVCSEDKMIAVAISAVTTIGVVAEGMGPAFKGHAKSLANKFLEKMKDAKLVQPTMITIGKMYGNCLTIGEIFKTCQGMVFPKKDKVVPPHAIVAVIELLASMVSRNSVPLSKDDCKNCTDMGIEVISKVSDPKIKAANVEMMVQLLSREKSESPDVEGPVAKALNDLLAGAKDSGTKLMVKKIQEGADPEGAAKAKEGGKKVDEKATDKAASGSKEDSKTASKDSKKSAKPGGDSTGKDGGSASKGGGGAASVYKRLDMDEDTAMTLLESLKFDDLPRIMKNMNATAGWQEKMTACEELGKVNYDGKVHSHSPALVTVLKAKTGKWTEKNGNVLKGCFAGVLACAKQSTEKSGFDKGAAKEMVALAAEKIGDKKMASVIREMMTALGQSCGFGFVAEELIRGIKEVKAIGNHQEAADWFLDIVREYGTAGLGDKLVADYAMKEFEAARTTLKCPKTKEKMVSLLGECYKRNGPAWSKKYLKNMSKDLEGPANAEFKKVGYSEGGASGGAPAAGATSTGGAAAEGGGASAPDEAKAAAEAGAAAKAKALSVPDTSDEKKEKKEKKSPPPPSTAGRKTPPTAKSPMARPGAAKTATGAASQSSKTPGASARASPAPARPGLAKKNGEEKSSTAAAGKKSPAPVRPKLGAKPSSASAAGKKDVKDSPPMPKKDSDSKKKEEEAASADAPPPPPPASDSAPAPLTIDPTQTPPPVPAESLAASPAPSSPTEPPPPLSSGGDAHASLEGDVLAALDALLAAPLPLDKEAQFYLDGKDVIKVLHALASGQECKFSFSLATLSAHADAIVVKLAACLSLSFECAPAQDASDAGPSAAGSGAGGIDVSFLSVCLAALMALFRVPEIGHALSANAFEALLAAATTRLLDQRLAAANGPYTSQAPAVSKALNKVAVGASTTTNRSSALTALLKLMATPPLPPASFGPAPKFTPKLRVIYTKLHGRVIAEEVENAASAPFTQVDTPALLQALNAFFQVVPKREALDGGADGSYDSAVSLLKRLVLHVGTSKIVGAIQAALPPPADASPLKDVLTREMPSATHGNATAHSLNLSEQLLSIDRGSVDLAADPSILLGKPNA